ncbi:MAG: hypothetical protein WCC53_13860 [Thermoanaerobaculia bacterium]|jgi:hypothetical protein
MKAHLALAAALALPLGLAAMPTAVEYLPAGAVTLKQSVKLGDGSVLPAGPYDVQIHYKGFGNLAEFHFFQGGVFKGKTNAEARGFPSQAPATVNGGGTASLKMGIKGESTEKDHKDWSAYKEQTGYKEQIAHKDETAMKEVLLKDQTGYKEQKTALKYEGKEVPASAGASQAFSWGGRGFDKGLQGSIVPVGRGMVKLLFDSKNSAAGFSAILPYVEKKK